MISSLGQPSKTDMAAPSPLEALPTSATTAKPPTGDEKPAELREAFDRFVGESFYGMLLKTMRQSVGKPAYFHGGQAEEIFQGQLDQMLSEQLSAASASTITDPMFELFQLGRP